MALLITFFFFGEHRFRRAKSAQKQVVSTSKKRSSGSPVVFEMTEVEGEFGRKEIVLGWFGLRLQSMKKQDIWLLFGCPRRTLHFNRKKRTNSLKRR